MQDQKQISKRLREIVAGENKNTSSFDGLTRQAVSRILRADSDPHLSSVLKIVKECGYELHIIEKIKE